MTAIAEPCPTQSFRECDAEYELQHPGAQRAHTPLSASYKQSRPPAAWLARWLLVTERLDLASALAESLRRTRSGTLDRLWAPVEDAFVRTPAWHDQALLEPLQGAVAAAPPPAQPAIQESAAAVKARPNPAVAAVHDLQQWLNLTVDQVADLVGTSKSAIHYWKRENAHPRPGAARNLYRAHALVRALRATTAPDSPIAALTYRPPDGGPSAYDLLADGRYEEAEHLLRPLIFRRHEQPVQRPRLIVWEDHTAAPASPGHTPGPPDDRARRITPLQ